MHEDDGQPHPGLVAGAIAHPAMRSRMASRLPLPRLYAILDQQRTGGRLIEDICQELLRAGLRLFQYRHKRGSSREMLETVSRLLPMIRRESGLLMVNDRADVALVAGADGVHLGQEDLPAERARGILRPGQLVGQSTHNLGQLRRSDASSADYVAFGPVFATTGKDAPDPTVGLHGLDEARRATSKPLVAIGGITAQNARQVIAHGADSVAVMSGLLGAGDLSARAQEFLNALQE